MWSWIPTVKRDWIASWDWLSHGPTTAGTGLIPVGLHVGVESVYFFKSIFVLLKIFKLQIRKPQPTFPTESEISDLSMAYFTKSQIPCWGSLFPFHLCLHKSQTTQIQFKSSLYSTLVSAPFSPSLCKIVGLAYGTSHTALYEHMLQGMVWKHTFSDNPDRTLEDNSRKVQFSFEPNPNASWKRLHSHLSKHHPVYS